jgi:mRNA-degrading endonuclease RelE of RelBE toxin-antitoxin system
MSFEIEITKRFEKELKKLCKKYTSLKSEYNELIEKLAYDPKTGTALGNNCFKIRISISSKQKGKSGGARVITHFFIEANTVYLLSIYDKSEKSTISQKEINQILKSIL